MRDDPYPSRYYPRLEEEPALEPVAGAAAASTLGRDFRRAISILVALYLLVAVVFALSARANAASLIAPLGAAGQQALPGHTCTGAVSLAHR